MDKFSLQSLIWRRKSKEATSLDPQTASTSGVVSEEEEYIRNSSSLLSLQPWIFKKGSFGSVGGSSLKPLSYFRHDEIRECIFSSPPNSSPFRPFRITDGERVISRSHFGLLEMDDGVCLGSEGSRSRMLKSETRDVEHGSFGDFRLESSSALSPSKGSVDGILLFCLGVSIGVVTAILLNKAEVQNLNTLLKQRKDLVQDLREELEMKGSLSVKELTYGSCQNLRHADAKESVGWWEIQNQVSHSAAEGKEEHGHVCLHNAGENSEPLSKIEAELEAELERLEQNISASDTEQRISELDELDPVLVCNVVYGELRARDLKNEMLENPDASTRDSGATSTNQTYDANYAVSSKELSIRLHEVIEMRLQERIEKLERELEERQKHNPFFKGDNEKEFSMNHESPRLTRQNSDRVQPFCLNLSGEALDGYEEAYEEFMLMAGKERPPPPSSTNKGAWTEVCDSNSCSVSPEVGENFLWSTESNENDNVDDEGKMLILQILERRKQGSLLF